MDENKNEELKQNSEGKKIEQSESNKVEKKQDPGFKKVTIQKKSKGGRAFGMLVLLVLIGVGVWYFLYQKPNQNNNLNTSNTTAEQKSNEVTTWEKAYLDILVGGNNYKNLYNYKMQLIKLYKEDKVPTLVLMYENTTSSSQNKIVDVWKVDEDGKVLVNKKQFIVTDDGLKILYNIENGEYDWYLYVKQNEYEEYGNLKKLVNTENVEILQDLDMQTTYKVSEKETEGSIVKEKFEQKFVVINSKDLSKNWVETRTGVDEGAILKILQDENDLNKTASSIVSEIKDTIFKKADEIAQKIEKQKKEQEELQKAQVTVGNNVLKYGIYKSKVFGAEDVTIVIASDKTCSYSGIALDGTSKIVNTTGTYTFEYDKDNGYGSKANYIVFNLNDGTKAEFTVGDNKFSSRWLEFIFVSSNTTQNNNTNGTNNTIVNNGTENNNQPANNNQGNVENNNQPVNNNPENGSVENNNQLANNNQGSVENNNQPVNNNPENGSVENNNQPVNNNPENGSIENNNQSTSNNSENTQVDIGNEGALNLVKKLFGYNQEDGKLKYDYVTWVKDGNGKKYYLYKISWLVNNDHYSFIDTVLISADGKSYKEIGTSENYIEGQVLTRFSTEANF